MTDPAAHMAFEDQEAVLAQLPPAALHERMGRAGRARVLRFFTWQTVAARTAELYATLLSDDAADPALARRVPRPLAFPAGLKQEPRGDF